MTQVENIYLSWIFLFLSECVVWGTWWSGVSKSILSNGPIYSKMNYTFSGGRNTSNLHQVPEPRTFFIFRFSSKYQKTKDCYAFLQMLLDIFTMSAKRQFQNFSKQKSNFSNLCTFLQIASYWEKTEIGDIWRGRLKFCECKHICTEENIHSKKSGNPRIT